MLRLLPFFLYLSACVGLPTVGPTSSELTQSLHEDIILVDMDEVAANLNAARGFISLKGTFGDKRMSSETRISVGDMVSVSLFEAGGGLFSKLAAGSNATVLPEQPVSKDGAISVPYAGRVQAANLTPRIVETNIIKALDGKAMQPQALVTVAKSHGASLSVLMSEGGGGRIPLSLKGDKLLDIIAMAGGPKSPVHETFITLNRGTKIARVPLQTILSKPSENIYARAGDILTLTREPQTFTAAGAMAKNAVISFDAVGLTLEEAMAKAGGLLDQRSDNEGVFILRFEEVDFMRKLFLARDFSRYEGFVPVVYRLKLKDAASFFLAKRFPIRNKDILYISNAPLSDVSKVLTLFNLALTPASRVNGLVP